MVRAGFGINYDPYPLAFVRDMLTNYPEDLLLTVNPTVATYGAATQLKDGHSGHSGTRHQLRTRHRSGGLRHAVAAGQRGARLHRVVELQPAEAIRRRLDRAGGYVGSRQIKINQRLDLNAGQVLGAGTAGQPYFSKFGRTTATELLTPVGHNKYDSLQTTLAAADGQGRFGQLQLHLFEGARDLLRRPERRLSLDSDPAVHEAEPRGDAVRPHAHLRRGIRGRNFRSGQGSDGRSTGAVSKLVGGWRANGLIVAYSGQPFTVTSNNPLNAPNNSQRANLAKSSVQILGGTGPNQSYFDPLRLLAGDHRPSAPPRSIRCADRAPSTSTAGCSARFSFTERWKMEFRAEALNLTNTPHFSNPGDNVSNMVLNPDGTIRSLGGYTVITSTLGTGREGIDERMFRLGLRITF